MSVIRLNTKKLRYRPSSGKVFFTVEDLEDYPEWPESELIEIINGDLFVVPSPSIQHQRLSQHIEFQILKYLDLNPIGELFHAPIDVELSQENLVVPDIIVVTSEQRSIIEEKRIVGAPSLIIEIVSSNKKRDMIVKKQLYEDFKVKEYILCDPVDHLCVVYRINEQEIYGEPVSLTMPCTIQLSTLDNLEITVHL